MEEELSKKFIDEFKKYLPSRERIINQAIDRILKENNVSDFKILTEKIGFSEVITRLENIAHEIYLNYEKEALKKVVQKMNISIEKFIDIMLKSGCKTMSNIRKGRAGLTIELFFNYVLKEIGIPSEIVGRSKKLKEWFGGYTPDIIIPSIKEFLKNPDKAIAVAIKRTCRERWREDKSVFKAPNGVFIALYPEEKDWKEFNIGLLKSIENEGFRIIFINDRLYKEKENIINKVKIKVKKLSDFPEYVKNVINTFTA